MAIEPNRAQAIFLAAVELREAAARTEFLDRECGSDAVLRDRVERLLASHQENNFRSTTTGEAGDARGTTWLRDDKDAPGTFVPEAHRPKYTATADLSPAGPTDTLESTLPQPFRPSAELGTVIAGRYILVELIGEGGMGRVFLARQTDPVQRSVALKLIKTGMDSKAVLARFDAERQVLALMDHPNIARIYDGGLTPTGQPFFVMELVNGVPLTDYCDQKRLSVEARLQLFVSVCQAVQHAHHKGIIHRDLKPGNVLVAEIDGRPTPKVIDFGVAKATESPFTEKSLSDTGSIVGTPRYMSPEQADPSSLDIDTRTDVYSLGVMLYELLTGTLPIDSKLFQRGAILEMLRMVREVEPSRPSTKLCATDDLAVIAANRNIAPTQLPKLLRGELDCVVMKTLEKDRNHRYDTANGIAADVQRYLRGEPVQAVPPSLGYRLRKSYRRNRIVTWVAAAFLLLTYTGATSIYFAYQRAVQAEANTAAERDRAQQERDEARRQRSRARAVLDAMLSEQAVEWFSVWKGITPEQQAYLTDLVARYRELVADDATDTEALAMTAGATVRMGKLLGVLGRPDDATVAFRTARDLYRRASEAEPDRIDWAREWAEAEVDAVYFLFIANRFDEATALVRGVVEQAEHLAARDPSGEQALAAALSAEGASHSAVGRVDLALAAHARACDVWQRMLARQPGEPKLRKALADNLTLRAGLISTAGRPADAAPLHAEALKIREQLYRDAPSALMLESDLGDSHLNFGLMLGAQQNRQAEALDSYNTAITYLRHAFDLAAPLLLRIRLRNAHHVRAAILHSSKRYQEAARDYERALELADAADQPALLYALAKSLYLAIQPDRALAASEAAVGTGQLSGAQAYELAFWAAATANAPNTGVDVQRDHAVGTAVRILRKAVAAGYRPPVGSLDVAPWLGPIRMREDFRAAYTEISGSPPSPTPAPPPTPPPAPAPVAVPVPLPTPAREVAPPPRAQIPPRRQG